MILTGNFCAAIEKTSGETVFYFRKNNAYFASVMSFP
jgi:hypothetical protein